MMKSKGWNWNIALAPYWKETAGDVYPLLTKWKGRKFKKFLDLGCGMGRHSIFFAKNGFEVFALDIAKAGLEKLKKATKEKGLKIKINQADMLKLPYKDSFFDCLLAFHAIYHQDDDGIKKVINEIKRVLKKGGEAYITFNSTKSSSFKSDSVQRVTKNTIIKTKGHEKGIPHYYASKKDVLRLLAGFEILEFTYKEEYYPNYTGAHYFVLVKK